MPATTVAEPVLEAQKKRTVWVRFRWWVVGTACLLVAFAAYLIFLALNWPFTEQSVIDVLQQATLRTVKIDHFRKTIFPPGCVAEGVRFEHHVNKNKPPIIYIQTLVVHESWWELLTAQYRLSLVKVSNMHVLVPPAEVHGKPDPIMPLNHTSSSVKTLRIDKIIADGAVLDFAHEDGSAPYRLTVDKLAVYNLSNNSAINYKTALTNSLPPGTIRSEGVFGPWRPNDPPRTPVKGTYQYEHANLGAFKDLSGTLSAHGKFDGTVGEIQTRGSAVVSKFHVTDASHYRELKTTYRAHVNGTNGDTILDEVHGEFDRSALDVKGSIAGSKSKSVSLDLVCRRGRIEDVLDLFIEARRSPMAGALQMRAHVDVPPGGTPFLRRMRMSGDFGVGAGRFTDDETQADMNRLSASSDKGKQKDDSAADIIALSNLRGHGEIRNGVATLTNVGFVVPGATAEMHGTYSIIDYAIDMHGKLYTDGKPWTATTGFKSLMMRVVTPFLEKKKNVRVVPFKITGNYGRTNVSLDLGSKK